MRPANAPVAGPGLLDLKGVGVGVALVLADLSGVEGVPNAG